MPDKTGSCTIFHPDDRSGDDREMTGKKETGATWHHTTVVLREDIYRQALARGIDISDACNRALAGLTGSEYHQQREEVPAPPPVIIAKDGASPHIPGR